MTCIVAPIYSRQAGVMQPLHLIISVLGTMLMAFVIVGSLVPVPAWPSSLIPYLFAVHLAAGMVWFASLRQRDPQALARLAHVWEG